MIENKISSIDWLIDTMHRSAGLSQNEVDEIIEQAKIMYEQEQEQLSARWAELREQTRKTAMYIGFKNGFHCGLECYDEYFFQLDETKLSDEDFTNDYIRDRYVEDCISKTGGIE